MIRVCAAAPSRCVLEPLARSPRTAFHTGAAAFLTAGAFTGATDGVAAGAVVAAACEAAAVGVVAATGTRAAGCSGAGAPVGPGMPGMVHPERVRAVPKASTASAVRVVRRLLPVRPVDMVA